MARPFPSSLANDPESLRQRLLLLEEYMTKDLENKRTLDMRVGRLEEERRATAQGIDGMVVRMKEFGNMFLELPSAHQLRAVVTHLDWLGDRRIGEASRLEEVLSRLDARMVAIEELVEKADRRIFTVESSWDQTQRLVSRCATVAESKADRADHDNLVASTDRMFKELRYYLDSKADKFEADRLAEALNQSYRDFSHAVTRSRHGIFSPTASLELGTSLSSLDEACRDLKKSFAHRQEEGLRSRTLQESLRQWPSSVPILPPPESSNGFRRSALAGSSSTEKLRSQSPSRSISPRNP
jgi:hypothetical protein